MDFVVGLPLTRRKHDSVWVVVDLLTKSTHFLPVRTDYLLDKLAELYIKEIIRLHRIQISIISVTPRSRGVSLTTPSTCGIPVSHIKRPIHE